MSRMGMIKTLSSRFGHVMGEHDSDSDDGANPLPNTKRRDKRSKDQINSGPAPAIFVKPEKKDLKEGHNPNKINGMGVSRRQIVVQPSMRHLNLQASMRDFSQLREEDLDPAQPTMRNLGVVQPSMRNLDKKSSMRNLGMNGLEKKSSMRNMGMNGLQKKSSMRNMGMNGLEKNGSNRNMSSLDKKTSVRNINNGMPQLTSINGKSTRLIDTIDEKGSLSKMNSIEESGASGISTIVEDPLTSMSSIDEESTHIIDTINEKTPMRSLTSIDENSNPVTNPIHNKNNMRSLNTVKSTRIFDTIDEESSEVMDTIDEKDNPVDEKGSINSNHSNVNKLNGSNNSKSSYTSTGTKSTASTSTKSTASINSKSTASPSNKNTVDIDKSNKSTVSTSSRSNASSIQKNIVEIDKSNRSAGSTNSKSNPTLSKKNVIDIDIKSTIMTDNKSNGYHNNSHSNGMNKSGHSKSSDKSRNIDTRNIKSRDRRPNKRTSIGVPHQFDRDRPSTALITRKELEEILNVKRKEELLESQTMPSMKAMHGTLSTNLWVNAANDNTEDQSSHCSDLEESPGSQKRTHVEIDEYDIKFTEFSEEEVSVHSDHMDSFDSEDFDLADSMDRETTTIRFDEYDELQTCLHINDYTKHEIIRSWYKRDDYDKMVDLARKTASKAVKRDKELKEESIRISQSPPRRRVNSKSLEDAANRGDDDNGNLSGDNKSVGSGRSKRSTGTADTKRKKPIEYRGLEAWTPEGSAKCRMLKETAIELVWNEQSRQWEDGTFDPEAISHVYIPVARKALAVARERAIADEKMAKKLLEQERMRAEKKRNRTVLNKSKSAIKKTAKSTGKGLVQGGTKVLKQTGKMGMKIGKRGARATLGVVTADPRMMKEAVTQTKKRECKHQMIISTSQAAQERDVEELEESGSLSLQDSNAHLFANGRPGLIRPGLQRPTLGVSFADKFSDKASDVSDRQSALDYSSRSFGESDSRRSHADSESNFSSSPNKKKKSKLKLLGVVPIPGTQKMYSEDRREQRAKERLAKMIRRPSWEASSIAGKY